MATANTDYTKMMQDMMAAFPTDMSAMQDSFRSYAAFGEKMSKVAFEAVEKSTDLSAKYTKDTLGKMNALVATREEPQDYAKAMTDFASAQAEITAETMAAFGEVAKTAQMETVELMLAAGKDMTQDATKAAQNAGYKASDAATHASDATKRAAATANDAAVKQAQTAK